MGLNAVGSTDATSRDTFTGFFMESRRLQIHMRKQSPFPHRKLTRQNVIIRRPRAHHLAIAATAFTLPNLLALL
jgi:hypothetical protein